MKKFYAVILAIVFALATTTVAMAASSPIAPTLEPYETTKPAPTTQRTTAPFVRPTSPSYSTPGNVDDNDRTTASVGSDDKTTARPDKNPSSPETGSFTQSAGKITAAAGTVLALAAAGVYVSKKKVTE